MQTLLSPEVAGVMFTQNPMSGADERVIEASWGLGEAVVAGLVIPDHFRIDRSGQVLERKAGLKRLAVRPLASGGTVEEKVPAERAEQLCLDDDQLAELDRLATRSEQVYGPGRDIEWAFAGGTLYLLQCRAVTRAGPSGSPGGRCTHRSGLGACRSSPSSTTTSSTRSARLFKERRFAEGETVIREGSGGAAFFLIDSGTAKVTIGGEERVTLRPGDYFGEIALIDEGTRIGDGDRPDRTRLLRAHPVGVPAAGRGERTDRLEAPAVAGEEAAGGRALLAGWPVGRISRRRRGESPLVQCRVARLERAVQQAQVHAEHEVPDVDGDDGLVAEP